jgi:site-specific DNA-methyltransferase (adenine-specific)
MKPYYEDSHATLYLGDCREVVPSLEAKVDLLLTDPPYGVGWDTDYRRISRPPDSKSFRARKCWAPMIGEDAPFDPMPWLAYPQVILWGANCYSDRLPQGRCLVWDKRFANRNRFFPSDGEVAWMKGGHSIRIHSQTWQGACKSGLHATERGPKGGAPSLHPTQKPVALMQWCIQQAKHVTTVLDPYCGSGSTLIGAKTLAVRAIGCEIEEQHAETAARRLEQTAAGEALA